MNTERLTREIGWLAETLWGIVAEAAGTEAAQLVQQVLTLAQSRRRGALDAEAELLALIRRLTAEQIETLIGAYSIFFDLANLAEDRHRIRVLRSRQARPGDAERPESIGAAFRQIQRAGIPAVNWRQLLERLSIDLVFTAHPTEAKRKSVREKIRDLRQSMAELDHDSLLPRERERTLRKIVSDLRILWRTDLLRQRKPRVSEEVRRALYFTRTLWDVIPQLHADLVEAVGTTGAVTMAEVAMPIRFGSWIGGDRDGHPGVTQAVTAETLGLLRDQALAFHCQECRTARRMLSLSDRTLEIPPALKSELAQQLHAHPQLSAVLEPIAEEETIRRFLRVIEWRLAKTREALPGTVHPGAYPNPQALHKDLELVRTTIAALPGGQEMSQHLSRWQLQTRVFGFHLKRLDIRQESGWYVDVITEILQSVEWENDYRQLAEADRQRVLLDTLHRSMSPDVAAWSESTRETWELFLLLARLRQAGTADCLGIQIVSMTHHPSDVLVVLWLETQAARAIGGVPEDCPGLPIAPLLETIDDLRHAQEILAELLAIPAYRAHVQRAGRQFVMVGYSDSTKDGGYLAANWSLYTGQSHLRDVTSQHGIPLTVFHGRGGSLGRGGGPTARAIQSLPPGTCDGTLRITEQGEVLAQRYDDPAIAYRHLEQVTAATLLLAAGPPVTVPAIWYQLLERLSEASYAAYRDLVESPGFVAFFEQATPIAEIEQLPIGSRPTRRRSERTLESLRAIPWVFSWTQNRCLLPAWYGLGASLDRWAAETPQALAELQAMYRQWPFFEAVVGNAELALAKADLGIAQLYAGLVTDPDSRSEIWNKIAAEFSRTQRWILAIKGSEQLLESLPWLQWSIELRNPYVDPLNMLQIELKRRIAADVPGAEGRLGWSHLARLTAQAIAGGLRTTG